MIIESHISICECGSIKIPDDAVLMENRPIAWYRKVGNDDWAVGEHTNNKLLIPNSKDDEKYEIKYPKAGESDCCRRCRKPVNEKNGAFYLCFAETVTKPLLVKDIIPLCNDCVKIMTEDAEEWAKFCKELQQCLEQNP